MPSFSSACAISRARPSRPSRTDRKPSASTADPGSMPRPTTWTVVSPQVTEISTPPTNSTPSLRAASPASSRPSTVS